VGSHFIQRLLRLDDPGTRDLEIDRHLLIPMS
jgi:hypothetical protein